MLAHGLFTIRAKGLGASNSGQFCRMAADQKKMSEWSAILTLIVVENFLIFNFVGAGLGRYLEIGWRKLLGGDHVANLALLGFAVTRTGNNES